MPDPIKASGDLNDVARAFQPAGSGDFPVACSNTIPDTGLESPSNPPAGKPALRDKAPSHLVAGFHSRGVLPHLKRQGAAYFVTFRLKGTLPKEVLIKLKAERERVLDQALAAKRPLTWHEQEELFRWYSSRVDKYLDAGQGECRLKEPQIARLVAGALVFHAGVRFKIHSWCVMPNHVHAVVCPMQGWTLSKILQSWKGYTAYQANKLLNLSGTPFWQSESYEHLIRDEQDMRRCCEYTTLNPVTAGLCKQAQDWQWSSAGQTRQPNVAQTF